MIYQRLLKMDLLLPKKSFFLFGPRSSGKTTLIHQQFPDATFYDLLDVDIYTELLRRPKIIEEKLILTSNETKPIIIIDEIQKLPKLLDEVHRLIEKFVNLVNYVLSSKVFCFCQKRAFFYLAQEAAEKLL